MIKNFQQLSVITCLALLIWLAGNQWHWEQTFPLLAKEKRLYVIAFLYLLWLFKFLVRDLASSPPPKENPRKLASVDSKIRGILQFLKKTTTTKHGQTIHLDQLPWYLLIGAEGCGKTTFLAHSNVHYVLKPQFQPQHDQSMASSDNCDWWITRDISIVDVPGKYLTAAPHQAATSTLWKFFLRTLKKQRGKHALQGIIIALPLTELVKQNDPRSAQHHLQQLLLRINELQHTFPYALSYHVVITKCDQLPGFKEFFSELTEDELMQAWGITLPPLKSGEKIQDLFIQRFNALIKKLNQQLIWRLHQERNPMNRPYVKDFPLQVERLKENLADFIKKLSTQVSSTYLRSIHLTSAQQPDIDETITINTPHSTQRAVQLFKEPSTTSRAYFIKQFILQGLPAYKGNFAITKKTSLWKSRIAYATSLSIISLAAILFAKDFEQGIKQAYSIQNTLSEYQLAIQQPQDADEHLTSTLVLLNNLFQAANQPGFKLDVLHVLTFFSDKSKKKSNTVYLHALQTILIPELKNYFAEYLKNPINKNSDLLYATLKAYLMLGDSANFQTDFITNTLQDLLPKSMHETDRTQLLIHLHKALSVKQNPLPLDNQLIQDTRKYLVSLPSFQLSYIILKNINNNNSENDINLGTNHATSKALISNQILNRIPTMFTAKAFATIIAQQAQTATQESIFGNWVLGTPTAASTTPEAVVALLEQLKHTYVNNYVDVWESLLANIHLSAPKSLAEMDALILNLINNDSPLLQLLQTLHDNTYFEPIISSSPKLQNLGLLVDKQNPSNNTLYQIFTGLQSLHQHLHGVLSADNQRKAAFDLVSARMQHQGNLDCITELRLIADKSPEPIKTWLDSIANESWHFLLQEATRYIDMSWQEQVGHIYQTDIENRYPFNATAEQEVDIKKFTDFFGNPGIVLSFYNHYLLPFIDTTQTDWTWKTIENEKLPFSDTVLQQFKYALRIHTMFFPNDDNKLHVQFALQPYQVSKFISRIKLSINDKKIIDQRNNLHNTHLLNWPSQHELKMTSIQFTSQDQKTVVSRDYPGDWGWFKLVNQCFISMTAQKAMLLNLSEDNHPVKYLLYTQGAYNPFLSLNLQNFHLPKQLIESDKAHA